MTEKKSPNLRHSLTLDEAENYTTPEFLGRFPLGFTSIIASKPGVGKTWYMLYNLYEHSLKANVGAIVADCSPTLIYDRVRKISNPSNSANMFVYFLSEMQQNGFLLDISTQDGLTNIQKLITQHRLKELWLDTLISLISTDESSQREITPIMQGLVRIATNTGCAIVVNHHLRKGQDKEKTIDIDSVIGSSVITRLAGVVLLLTKSQKSMVHIACAKNWFAEPKSGVLSIGNVGGSIVLDELETTPDGSYVTQKSTVLHNYITKKVPVNGVFKVSDLYDMFGVSMITGATIRNVLNSLTASGVVAEVELTKKEPFMDRVYQKLK